MSTRERSSVAQGDRYRDGSTSLCASLKKKVEEVKQQIRCRTVSNTR